MDIANLNISSRSLKNRSFGTYWQFLQAACRSKNMFTANASPLRCIR